MGKHTFWRYAIPSQNGQGWGIFILCSDGTVGAVTDYGNYAYCWSGRAAGVGIREFLVGCDGDYVRRKMAPGEVFDLERTVESIKETVLLERRANSFNAERARRYWDELDDLVDERDWEDWMRDTDFPDAWEHTPYHSPSADAMAFQKRLFPRLQMAILADLAEERVTDTHRRAMASALAAAWCS